MSIIYSSEYVEKRLKEMVLNSIAFSYHIKGDAAILLIDNSSFIEILKEDPEFIGHYPPEYWANYIIEERDLISKS